MADTHIASVAVAVLSSLTAIVVMWRSNANSRRNLREQLKQSARQADDQLLQASTHFGNQLDHDARQRNLEREMSLRRDVYLPAAEAIVRIQAALGRLTDINADQVEIGRQLADDFGTLAKAHLIASESTVRALMIYQKTLMTEYLELLTLRNPLVVKKMMMETHQTFIDRADAEVQRFLQLMKQHNIAGNTDRAAFDRLFAQYENEENIRARTTPTSACTSQGDGLLGQIALAERMGEIAVKGLVPDT